MYYFVKCIHINSCISKEEKDVVLNGQISTGLKWKEEDVKDYTILSYIA
jgi:hypothetical protein